MSIFGDVTIVHVCSTIRYIPVLQTVAVVVPPPCGVDVWLYR